MAHRIHLVPARAGRHLLAPELRFETLLINEADAEAEAQRLLEIHGQGQVVYDVPVPLKVVRAIMGTDGRILMKTVTLKLNRFGMDDGQNFRITGVRYELKTRKAILSLWGLL